MLTYLVLVPEIVFYESNGPRASLLEFSIHYAFVQRREFYREVFGEEEDVE